MTAETAPRLAVIVPNYNHMAFLERSLGSIRDQTRPADQVVVVDDASTDDSRQVIASFVEADPRWRLVRNPSRKGVIDSLNTGLAATDADAVAFLGADDELAPGFLEAAGAALASWPTAAFASGCAALAVDGQPVAVRPPVPPSRRLRLIEPEAFRILLRDADNYFLGTTTLYRTSAVRRMGGFESALGALADGMLSRRLAARHGFVFIPQVLGTWHLHGTNLSVEANQDPAEVDRQVDQARQVLAEEPEGLFEPDYAARLARRLRFGGARLLVQDSSLSPDSRGARIATIAGGGRLTARLTALLLRLGLPGRVAVLAALTLYFRPLSLRALWRLAAGAVSSRWSRNAALRGGPSR